MTENELTREEKVRVHALKLAIEAAPDFTTEPLVITAIRFEAYIKLGS